MKNLALSLMLCVSSLAFAKPELKDPKVDLAKKASWSLLQEHLLPFKPLGLVQIKLIERKDDFFLTQVIVDMTKSTKEHNARWAYCFVLQVATSEDGTLGVAYIENNNDVKDVYVQECSSTPTAQEINKLKQQNIWPAD